MNIALIAHDSKKILMQNFVIAYQGILGKHTLYATGTTGKVIEEVTTLKIHKNISGILGGEQQISYLMESNELDLLIFLRDPNQPLMRFADGITILQLADIHNVPVATNLSTAELLILDLDHGDFAFRELYS